MRTAWTLLSLALLAAAVLVYPLADHPPERRIGPPDGGLTGEQVAERYCQSCHLLPVPGQLPRETWPFAIDWMGNYLGYPKLGGPFERLVAKRLIGIVSRGGSLLAKWMIHHEQENLMAQIWDDICELVRRYDVTFSIGDGLRPGGLADATDLAQLGDGVEQRAGHEYIEARGRFVKDQYRRIVNNRAGDRDFLLHAGRHLGTEQVANLVHL